MNSNTKWPFKYFTKEELECKCGCGGLPENSFIEKLEALRVLFGPMNVTSGYRCPDYNAKVSSTGKNGPHTTGRAVDIQVSHAKAYELVRLAIQNDDFRGIGLQQKGQGRFVHLDDLPNKEGQPRPTVWTY